MKVKRRLSYLLISSVAISPVLAENQTVDSHIGKLELTHDFANGYPTKEPVEKLYDERDFQRACATFNMLVGIRITKGFYRGSVTVLRDRFRA